MMKIFTCNNFIGHYPVGTAAVMSAENEEQARAILATELERVGLLKYNNPANWEIVEFPTIALLTPTCLILRDGDY